MRNKKQIRKELRFSEEEIKLLEIRSKLFKMNVTQYIRYCISKIHENEQIEASTRLFNNNQEYLQRLIENIVYKAVNDNIEYLFKKALNEVLKEDNYVIQKKRNEKQ